MTISTCTYSFVLLQCLVVRDDSASQSACNSQPEYQKLIEQYAKLYITEITHIPEQKPAHSAVSSCSYLAGDILLHNLIEQACLPATAAWEVIVDIGYSRQHVHREWNVRKVDALCTLLRQVTTAAIQRRAKSILRRWTPAPNACMNARPYHANDV